MKIHYTLGAIALLAGCVEQAQIETAPHSVTRLQGFQSAGLIEYERTTVRTFAGTSGKKTEIKGVPCTLASKTYTVRFVTPAVVNVPDYGKASPIPVVSCEYAGAKRNVAATLYNKTSYERKMNYANAGGLLGILVVEIAESSRKNKQGDDWSFQPVEVRFDQADAPVARKTGNTNSTTAAAPAQVAPRSNECPLCE